MQIALQVLMLTCLLTNLQAVQAQEFAITTEVNNVVYRGVSNPLKVVVSNVACKNITLTASHCAITQDGCAFSVCPDSTAGNVIELEVFERAGNKLRKIGSAPFRCVKAGPAVAYVGNLRGGTVSKKKFSLMGAVVARLENPVIDVPLKIESFQLSLYRAGSTAIEWRNEGGRFGEELTKVLATLQNHDRIVISNILVRYPDSTSERIQPLEFDIIDE